MRKEGPWLYPGKKWKDDACQDPTAGCSDEDDSDVSIENEPDDDIKDILDESEVVKEAKTLKDEDPLAQNVYQIFYSEIKRHPLLTAKQEKDLARRIREEGDTEAYQTFILSNLRLVIATAKRIQWRYGNTSLLGFMDLIQEGIMGLIIAVQRFDHRRNTRFSTYGMFWIRQKIRRAMLSHRHGITVPFHTGSCILTLNDMIRKYHEGKVSEIPKKMRNRIHTLHRIAGPVNSLNSDAGDEPGKNPGVFDIDRFNTSFISGDDEMFDPMTAPDDFLEESEFREKFRAAAARVLPRSTFKMVAKRFGFPPYDRPHSLREIGDGEGKSQEYVRNRIDAAVKKMRNSTEMKEFFLSWRCGED